MNNSLKGHLGLCRRAGKISIGHDASKTAIKSRKAKLAICCSDASDRLKREIQDECSFDGRNIKYIEAPFENKELALAIGTHASIITIDDEGFAKMLYNEILGGNSNGSNQKD